MVVEASAKVITQSPFVLINMIEDALVHEFVGEKTLYCVLNIRFVSIATAMNQMQTECGSIFLDKLG